MITAKELVGAGLYPNEESVIQEALRILWQEKPQLRIDWAVYQYQTDEISVAKAAALAGVSFDRMKEILVKHGIQPRLGSETVDEARQEFKALNELLGER